MKRAQSTRQAGAVSEMAIVDTFTKLIFGEDTRYSTQELHIIQAFRMVDTNVVFDSHRDMGAYLRALGVQEMIQLVTRVQQQLAKDAAALTRAPRAAPERNSILDRRVH